MKKDSGRPVALNTAFIENFRNFGLREVTELRACRGIKHHFNDLVTLDATAFPVSNKFLELWLVPLSLSQKFAASRWMA